MIELFGRLDELLITGLARHFFDGFPSIRGDILRHVVKSLEFLTSRSAKIKLGGHGSDDRPGDFVEKHRDTG